MSHRCSQLFLWLSAWTWCFRDIPALLGLAAIVLCLRPASPPAPPVAGELAAVNVDPHSRTWNLLSYDGDTHSFQPEWWPHEHLMQRPASRRVFFVSYHDEALWQLHMVMWSVLQMATFMSNDSNYTGYTCGGREEG